MTDRTPHTLTIRPTQHQTNEQIEHVLRTFKWRAKHGELRAVLLVALTTEGTVRHGVVAKPEEFMTMADAMDDVVQQVAAGFQQGQQLREEEPEGSA